MSRRDRIQQLQKEARRAKIETLIAQREQAAAPALPESLAGMPQNAPFPEPTAPIPPGLVPEGGPPPETLPTGTPGAIFPETLEPPIPSAAAPVESLLPVGAQPDVGYELNPLTGELTKRPVLTEPPSQLEQFAQQAVQTPLRIVGAGLKALSPLSLPFHAVQVDLMRKPELLGTALRADLLFDDEALSTMPTPSEARQRVEAVKTAQEAHLALINRLAQEGANTEGMPLDPSEEIIQAHEAQIKRRDDDAWFSVTLPDPLSDLFKDALEGPARRAGLGVAEDLMQLNEQRFLQSRGFSPEAYTTVERVREMSKDEMEDPVTLNIDRGLQMVGYDVLVAMADPLLALGAVGRAGRAVRELTFEDEIRRVGFIPALKAHKGIARDRASDIERLLPAGSEERKVLQEAQKAKELLEPSIIKEKVEAAEVGVMRAAEAKIAKAAARVERKNIKIDPDILAKSDPAAVESAILRQTREDLATTVHSVKEGEELRQIKVRTEFSDELIDEVIGATGTVKKDKAAFREIVKKYFPNINDASLERKTNKLIRRTAPLRAWMQILEADAELRQAKDIASRTKRMVELYEESLQNVSKIKAQVVETFGKLGKDVDLKDLEEAVDPLMMQEFMQGLGRVDSVERAFLQDLTGFRYSPLGLRRWGGVIDLIREPRNVLGGTGVYERIREARRSGMIGRAAIRDRLTREFGELVNNPTLDDKIGMALTGRKVETLQDGSQVFHVDFVKDKKSLFTDRVVLTPDEVLLHDKARVYADDLASLMIEAGVPGVKSGMSPYELMERAFDFKPTRRSFDYQIPLYLADVVRTSGFLKHLHSMPVVENLAKAGWKPSFSEFTKILTEGVLHKKFMEPAIRDAGRIGQQLPLFKQKYWNRWKEVLLGIPGTGDKVVASIIEPAITVLDDLLARMPGTEKLRSALVAPNPATRMSLFVTRAFYRGILGGHLGAGLVNLSQNINTAAVGGPLHLLKGFAFFLTPEGQKLVKSMRLQEDFISFFERQNPVFKRFGLESVNTWDDVILAPMHLTEHIDRGLAFTVGVSIAAGEMGVNTLKNITKLPEEKLVTLLRRGLITAEETQFIYGKLGTSPYLMNAAGRFATTLISYPIKQVEFLHRLLKNDPTGLMRYFAFSGFMTRFARDMMGIATEDIVGFGFLPPQFREFPLSSPQVGFFADVMKLAATDDPFERRQVQRRLFDAMNNFLAGAARLPMVPIPREVVPGDMDLGGRAGRSIARMMRELKTGEEEGPMGIVHREMEPQELTIRALTLGGLRTAEAQKAGRLRKEKTRVQQEQVFRLREAQEKIRVALREGDFSRIRTVVMDLVKHKIITLELAANPQALQYILSGAAVEAKVPFAERTLMRSPELGALEEGSRLGPRLREMLRGGE